MHTVSLAAATNSTTTSGVAGWPRLFRARDIRLDRVVAVKTLRVDLATDATCQARFRPRKPGRWIRVEQKCCSTTSTG